tara:strand:- start:5270 stop:6352 length:1083 start_codon:yes stop_codon:yes gene_type:complete
MDKNILYILILGLISSIFSLLLLLKFTPLIIRVALKNKFFDSPDQRKQKSFKTVRIGGLGIFISYFLAIFFFVIANYLFEITPLNNKYLLIFLLSSFSFFGIGFIDDFINLSPIIRLISQFIFAFFIWFNNIKIDNISFPFLVEKFQILIPNSLSLFLTSFWIVGLINALNWMDGIDGLATGISIICNFTFMIFCLSKGEYTLFLLTCSILGSTLGFLRFNHAPSKILMGDGGSYLLGINIALFGLAIFSTSSLNSQSKFVLTDILTPSIILCIPILDSIRVSINRIIKGYSPFFPDRTHIHHLLMNLKFSEQETVNILYLLHFLVCLVALWLNKIDLKYSLMMFLALISFRQIIIYKRK